MKKSTDEELETELIECDVIVRMPPKKRYKIQAVAKIIKKDELTIVESIYPKKNKEVKIENLTDEELKEALDTIEKINESCPSDMPNDISLKHDKYLAEEIDKRKKI